MIKRQIRNFLKAWEKELPPEKSIDQLISTLRDRYKRLTKCLYVNSSDKFGKKDKKSNPSDKVNLIIAYGRATFTNLSISTKTKQLEETRINYYLEQLLSGR